MTTGHRHRVVALRRGGLALRLLQTHLVATTDATRAHRSRLVWGHLTPDEPDYPRRLQRYGTAPTPDAYVLTPLSILHTLTGLTVRTRSTP